MPHGIDHAKRTEKRDPAQDAKSLLSSTDALCVAWRSEQSDVDADIEGLARDAGAEALLAELEKAGVPFDEQRKRLAAYFHDNPKSAAAE